MTSEDGTQLLAPPPAKDEEDSSEALNKLKFHTKKMNWNLKILKDQLTGLEDSGNSLSRQMASMYRTFQEMKEAGDISDVEIEIDEDELSSPNSRISDTTGIGSYDISYSADDAMDTEDELEEYSDLDTDSTTSSGQKKKKICQQGSFDSLDNSNEKRKRLTHRVKRQSSEIQAESESDSECDNEQCSCCVSKSSFGSVTPSRRYYFEDRSRADDTSSSSCSDYEEPIKRNTLPLHERHSPFYMPGQGNSSSEEEEDMCQDDAESLLTPQKEYCDRDSESSLQRRLSPLGCESPKHYDSHGNIQNAPSGNESDDKSLEDKVKELTVELQHCKEEISKRTKRKQSEGRESESLEQTNEQCLISVKQKINDNETDKSTKGDSLLNNLKISDKKKMFEKEAHKIEQKSKPALKRKDSIGNAMMDKLKAQFESSDAKTSVVLTRESLGAKGRRDSIQDRIKMIENKVQEESDKSDSSTLKSNSESRNLQKKLEATRKVSNALKNVFEKDVNQNDVTPIKQVKQTNAKNKHYNDEGQLLQIPVSDKQSKKHSKSSKEPKTNGTKHPVKSSLPRPTPSNGIKLPNPANETPEVEYEKRDKVAAMKKFQELQNMWQPKLVVNASGKQTKPQLQKRIQRLQKAAFKNGNPGIPKSGKRSVSRAVIQMNKKETTGGESSKTMEFSPDTGEVIIGETTGTDKDGYKTVKLRGNGLVVTLKINPNGKSGKSGDVKVCPSCHNHADNTLPKPKVGDEVRLVVPHLGTIPNQRMGDEMRITVPKTVKHKRIPVLSEKIKHEKTLQQKSSKALIPHAPQHQRIVPLQPAVNQTSQHQTFGTPTSHMQRRVSVPAKIMQDAKLPVRKMSTSSITTFINGQEALVQQPGQRFITVTPSESYNNQPVPRVVVRNHQMNPETGQQRITVIPIQTSGQTPRFQLKGVSGGGNTIRMQQSSSTTKYKIVNSRQSST